MKTWRHENRKPAKNRAFAQNFATLHHIRDKRHGTRNTEHGTRNTFYATLHHAIAAEE
jgi:hypothetical protein